MENSHIITNLGNGTVYKHSANKRLEFQQSIWRELPVQTCRRSMCSPEGIKAKRPRSAKLQRQNLIHSTPDSFTHCQPSSLSFSKKEFLKKPFARDNGYGSGPLFRFCFLCLVTRLQQKKKKGRTAPGTLAAPAHPSHGSNTKWWQLDQMVH